MVKVKIKCSRCGNYVPYDVKEFINIKGEPVCNKCLNRKRNMTEYLNSLKKT